ncbi:MAG: hypothetical protein HW421_1621 [Ignavibacteria bacterium]|nr:hypothetical protein [Ignavibacteria bacterium]
MPAVTYQYLTDTNGKPVAVVLPIQFWNSVFPQDETKYLMKSKRMKQRLIEALNRTDGFSIEEVREKLGI